jgi:hypothetical protein
MLAALVALVALFALPGVAAAADVFVTTTDDHSDQTGCTAADCTLREAASGRSFQDVIHVPAGTYNLTLGAITLSNGTLQGAGAGSTVIRHDAGTADNRVITVGTNAVATISGVTITGGRVTTQPGGGGVYVPAAASLVIVNSAIAGNTAGEGGGIFTQSSTSAGLTLIGTTVSGNTATIGGGVSVDAGFPAGTTIRATLTNSTVSGNLATNGRGVQGGGINTDGALTLTNTTVAANSVSNATGTLEGAGIAQGAGVGSGTAPTATIRNSIIAGNTGAAACQGDPATIAGWVDDHNLDDDNSCGFTGPTDRPGANPLLSPLGLHGGPTETHSLGAASPALNAGNPATCPATDQRGVTRPQLGGCDMGATEYVQPLLTVTASVINDNVGTAAPSALSVHVTAGADVAGSPQPGTSAGTTYSLLPGSYAVSAALSGYTVTYGGSCDAAGAVAIAENEAKTCTVVANDTPLPAPKLRKTANLLRARGTVRIKKPNSKSYKLLRTGEQVPVGTTVDARKGRVTLIAAADSKGHTARAVFYDGIFKFTQTKGKKPITVLRLVEKLTGCSATGKATIAKKKVKKRRLWGDGKGRFQTKGKHSAATVVGTKWFVEDRCTSTLTRVARGKVKVTDFVKHKTVFVKKGHKYVARAR